MTAAIPRWTAWLRTPPGVLLLGLFILFLTGLLTAALAHGVAEGDKGYIQETSGFLFWPFLYLGARHMVTGYDHLLFLLGVIFFLYLRAAPYRSADIRHPKSFLLRIALNLVRDESRRQKRQRESSVDFGQDQSESASQAEQLMLKQVVLSVPPLYRDIFVLSRFGGT